MAVQPGLAGSASMTVQEADTAVAHHSGDVPVLSTPRLVALCEEASLTAVSGELAAGETTVGMRVQFDHLAPSRVGAEVSAEAKLQRVEGRRLVFSVSAHDDCGVVGAGVMTRVVVNVRTFLAKAR